jgi:bifunctional non-homologous end joining protein LigD
VPEERLTVEVAGRTLSVSNLSKQLFPSGYTKGEVIAYYTAVAPVLLPHLAGRPLTLRRWPDGTAGPSFFEKNVARNAPAWMRTAAVPTPGSTRDRDTVEFVVVDDLPGLVWVANLAGLELHVPQWRLADDDEPLPPDRLVVDLDPGPPADLVACCRVALLVRDALAADGLALVPKTSGAKGLQAYAALAGSAPWEEVHRYAKQVAERIEREHPRLVVSRMEKALRRGKVLVDWSQNHRAKTTIAPYSLRGLPDPTVSTPVGWDEVEAVADGADPRALRFLADDVVSRVAERGDLLGALFGSAARLP